MFDQILLMRYPLLQSVRQVPNNAHLLLVLNPHSYLFGLTLRIYPFVFG